MGAEVLTVVFTGAEVTGAGPGVAAEAAARRTLRAQIALLESELAEAFVTAFEMRLGAPAVTVPAVGVPRLLDLGELEPGRYRFTRISSRELGEPGCGVWQVRPRLGPVGMLMGWWRVKLSSGCPLAGRLAAVEQEEAQGKATEASAADCQSGG